MLFSQQNITIDIIESLILNVENGINTIELLKKTP